MAANPKMALALGGAALGGVLLWALSSEAKTAPSEEGPIRPEDLPLENTLVLTPGEFYPDLSDEELMFYYEDSMNFPDDYNDQAVADLINTLAYRGHTGEAINLSESYGLVLVDEGK